MPGISIIKTKAYNKLVKNGWLYLTDERINDRSDNFVAQLSSGQLIRINKFVVDFAQKQEYVISHRFLTENHNLLKGHLCLKKIKNIGSDLEFDLVKNLERVCVCIEIDENSI